jgi:hypothetical protein
MQNVGRISDRGFMLVKKAQIKALLFMGEAGCTSGT